MYMDDIKTFAINEKELETLIRTIEFCCNDIGIICGIIICSLFMKTGRREKKITEINRSAELEKHQNTWVKE